MHGLWHMLVQIAAAAHTASEAPGRFFSQLGKGAAAALRSSDQFFGCLATIGEAAKLANNPQTRFFLLKSESSIVAPVRPSVLLPSSSELRNRDWLCINSVLEGVRTAEELHGELRMVRWTPDDEKWVRQLKVDADDNGAEKGFCPCCGEFKPQSRKSAEAKRMLCPDCQTEVQYGLGFVTDNRGRALQDREEQPAALKTAVCLPVRRALVARGNGKAVDSGFSGPGWKSRIQTSSHGMCSACGKRVAATKETKRDCLDCTKKSCKGCALAMERCECNVVKQADPLMVQDALSFAQEHDRKERVAIESTKPFSESEEPELVALKKPTTSAHNAARRAVHSGILPEFGKAEKGRKQEFNNRRIEAIKRRHISFMASDKEALKAADASACSLDEALKALDEAFVDVLSEAAMQPGLDNTELAIL